MSSNNFIQVQNQERQDYKEANVVKRKVTFETFLYSKQVKSAVVLLIFSLTVPVLLYYYVYYKQIDPYGDYYTCLVRNTFRVSCGSNNISERSCNNVNCCFDKEDDKCYHSVPSRYAYVHNEANNNYISNVPSTPYGNDALNSLSVYMEEINENKLRISLEEGKTRSHRQLKDNRNYEVSLNPNKLIVEVSRKTGEKVLTSSYGPLIASEGFWEWSFFLSNEYIFGLGQNLIKLSNNSVLTKIFYNNKDSHAIQPIIWGYENKKFHAVVLEHDGPLEVSVLPSNLVTLKSLTAKRIAVELYLGPTPADIHDQISGNFTSLPSWVMGTNFCRKGTTTNLKDILENYLVSPFSSDCIHENLLLSLMQDSSEIDSLKNILQSMTTSGQKFILTLPPHVLTIPTNSLYQQAKNLDILYKNGKNEYVGWYLGLNVAYPDFSNNKIQEYLKAFGDLVDVIGIQNIAGFQLIDNYPLDESYTFKNYSSFPYLSQGLIDSLSNTIPWNLKLTTSSTKHIDIHNQYAALQGRTLEEYLRNKNINVLILSPTKYREESHPLIMDHVEITWENMKNVLDNVLFNSINGNHLVSVPICGDLADYRPASHETLCIRWYLLASTMPMIRINSAEPLRDPSSMNTKYAQQIAETALSLRNQLLPYFNTILSRNEPIVRPMYYDYFDNVQSFFAEGQYMVGEDLLIAHPLSSGSSVVTVYLPESVGVWYEFQGGQRYKSTTKRSHIQLSIVESDWIGFLAQGAIIPLLNDTILDLVVGLDCSSVPHFATTEIMVDSNIVLIQASDTAVKLFNWTTCDMTLLGTVKLFSYKKQQYFYINKTICNTAGSDVVEILYENI